LRDLIEDLSDVQRLGERGQQALDRVAALAAPMLLGPHALVLQGGRYQTAERQDDPLVLLVESVGLTRGEMQHPEVAIPDAQSRADDRALTGLDRLAVPPKGGVELTAHIEALDHEVVPELRRAIGDRNQAAILPPWRSVQFGRVHAELIAFEDDDAHPLEGD